MPSSSNRDVSLFTTAPALLVSLNQPWCLIKCSGQHILMTEGMTAFVIQHCNGSVENWLPIASCISWRMAVTIKYCDLAYTYLIILRISSLPFKVSTGMLMNCLCQAAVYLFQWLCQGPKSFIGIALRAYG